MREKALGGTHVQTADALMKLAELEHQMGRDLKAELHYRRALEVWHLQGADHVQHVAETLGKLGAVLMSAGGGRFSEAERAFHRALGLCEQVCNSHNSIQYRYHKEFICIIISIF